MASNRTLSVRRVCASHATPASHARGSSCMPTGDGMTIVRSIGMTARNAANPDVVEGSTRRRDLRRYVDEHRDELFAVDEPILHIQTDEWKQ
jgi:hypothetical protein